MNTLHLNDTILGLMLINAAFNQAFAIWLLRGTFVSISPEMEQAACIDGCNTVGALWHILLPMAAPGIVTTLIFVFINSWNEYTDFHRAHFHPGKQADHRGHHAVQLV